MGRFGKPVLGVLREREKERTLRDMTQPVEKDGGKRKGKPLKHFREKERKALSLSTRNSRYI